MIIIPDVHGRTFWKEAVKLAEEKETVVFLGDYMEPYTDYEGITFDEAYDNFVKIIEYVKLHKDTTILLLGNHDFACLDDAMISNRHDRRNKERNRKIYTDNMELFQLAYHKVIGDKDYLLSHAGIHAEWLEMVKKDYPDYFTDENEPVTDKLNRLYADKREELHKLLLVVSRYRSWNNLDDGSCIWADMREWDTEETEIPGTYQIFGHTMRVEGDPVINSNWACLDTSKGYRLDETTGEIREA